MRPSILIVEDDGAPRRKLRQSLIAAGFDVTCVDPGKGLDRLRANKHVVCVVGLRAGSDCWELIETARVEGIKAPVVAIAEADTCRDRILALKKGADDFLVKPITSRDLVIRVTAAAERAIRREEIPRGDPIEIEELRIDPLAVEAYVDGRSAELTPTEFRLLHELALERGNILTRDDLLRRLWSRRAHSDRTVDVVICRLREKIDVAAPRHTFIQTRVGIGYVLEPVSRRGEGR